MFLKSIAIYLKKICYSTHGKVINKWSIQISSKANLANLVLKSSLGGRESHSVAREVVPR